MIDGCIEVLARDGYRRASLARIAQAARVSKGLVSQLLRRPGSADGADGRALDTHPEADPSAYADALADLLLHAMRRHHG